MIYILGYGATEGAAYLANMTAEGNLLRETHPPSCQRPEQSVHTTCFL